MEKRIKLIVVFLALSLTQINSQGNKINQLSKKEKKQGWVLLFDGSTSNGWTRSNGQPFPAKGWMINDGILTLEENAKAGDIVTIEEYSDFELLVDFKMDSGCNSGIKYFFTRYAKGGPLGLEFQLLDDAGASDNKIPNHTCGALYDIFVPDNSVKKMMPLGSWNTARIVSKGKLVEHWLNGIKVVSFERGSESYLAAVAKSKYKSDPVFGMVEKGRILLQDHDSEVSFRNIKLRKL